MSAAALRVGGTPAGASAAAFFEALYHPEEVLTREEFVACRAKAERTLAELHAEFDNSPQRPRRAGTLEQRVISVVANELRVGGAV